MTAFAAAPIGDQLRDWRTRRRMSQLDLALEAGVSARHLSFLETGRSRPSRDMVLRLCEELSVPLRDRNGLLLAAGYAPRYAEHDLDDPEMAHVREAIGRVLAGHELAAAAGIGLVPGFDVAVHDGVEVIGHGPHRPSPRGARRLPGR